MERQFVILYTNQKTKKAKTWQDGILKVCSTQNRAVLYDERKSKLDALYIRADQVCVGEELESDRYLIQVESPLNQPGEPDAPAPCAPPSTPPLRTRTPRLQRHPLQRLQPTVSTLSPNACVPQPHRGAAAPRSPQPARTGLKRKMAGFVPPRQVRARPAAPAPCDQIADTNDEQPTMTALQVLKAQKTSLTPTSSGSSHDFPLRAQGNTPGGAPSLFDMYSRHGTRATADMDVSSVQTLPHNDPPQPRVRGHTPSDPSSLRGSEHDNLHSHAYVRNTTSSRLTHNPTTRADYEPLHNPHHHPNTAPHPHTNNTKSSSLSAQGSDYNQRHPTPTSPNYQNLPPEVSSTHSNDPLIPHDTTTGHPTTIRAARHSFKALDPVRLGTSHQPDTSPQLELSQNTLNALPMYNRVLSAINGGVGGGGEPSPWSIVGPTTKPAHPRGNAGYVDDDEAKRVGGFEGTGGEHPSGCLISGATSTNGVREPSAAKTKTKRNALQILALIKSCDDASRSSLPAPSACHEEATSTEHSQSGDGCRTKRVPCEPSLSIWEFEFPERAKNVLKDELEGPNDSNRVGSTIAKQNGNPSKKDVGFEHDRQSVFSQNSLVTAKDGLLTAKEGCVRAKDGCVTAKEGCVTAKDGCVTAKDGIVTAKDGCVTVKDGCVTAKDGCVTAKDGCVTAKEGCVTAKEGCVTAKDGCVTAKEGCVTAKDGCVTAKNGCVTAKDGCVTAKDGCVTAKDGCVTAKDGCVTAKDGCVTAKDGCVTVEDGLVPSKNDLRSTEESHATVEEHHMTADESRTAAEDVQTIADEVACFELSFMLMSDDDDEDPAPEPLKLVDMATSQDDDRMWASGTKTACISRPDPHLADDDALVSRVQTKEEELDDDTPSQSSSCVVRLKVSRGDAPESSVGTDVRSQGGGDPSFSPLSHVSHSDDDEYRISSSNTPTTTANSTITTTTGSTTCHQTAAVTTSAPTCSSDDDGWCCPRGYTPTIDQTSGRAAAHSSIDADCGEGVALLTAPRRLINARSVPVRSAPPSSETQSSVAHSDSGVGDGHDPRHGWAPAAGHAPPAASRPITDGGDSHDPGSGMEQEEGQCVEESVEAHRVGTNNISKSPQRPIPVVKLVKHAEASIEQRLASTTTCVQPDPLPGVQVAETRSPIDETSLSDKTATHIGSQRLDTTIDVGFHVKSPDQCPTSPARVTPEWTRSNLTETNKTGIAAQRGAPGGGCHVSPALGGFRLDDLEFSPEIPFTYSVPCITAGKGIYTPFSMSGRTSLPVVRTTSQNTTQPPSQPTSQPMSQPTSQPTSQPMSQFPSQPTSVESLQTTGRPTSLPMMTSKSQFTPQCALNPTSAPVAHDVSQRKLCGVPMSSSDAVEWGTEVDRDVLRAMTEDPFDSQWSELSADLSGGTTLHSTGPGHTTGPSHSTKCTHTIGPSHSTEPHHATGPAHTTRHTHTTEPAHSMEHHHTTEHTHTTGPAHSTGRTHTTEPAHSTELHHTTEHTHTTEPAHSTGCTHTTEPAHSTELHHTTEHTHTTEPAHSTGRTHTTEHCHTTEPLHSTEPSHSTGPHSTGPADVWKQRTCSETPPVPEGFNVSHVLQHYGFKHDTYDGGNDSSRQAEARVDDSSLVIQLPPDLSTHSRLWKVAAARLGSQGVSLKERLTPDIYRCEGEMGWGEALGTGRLGTGTQRTVTGTDRRVTGVPVPQRTGAAHPGTTSRDDATSGWVTDPETNDTLGLAHFSWPGPAPPTPRGSGRGGGPPLVMRGSSPLFLPRAPHLAASHRLDSYHTHGAAHLSTPTHASDKRVDYPLMGAVVSCTARRGDVQRPSLHKATAYRNQPPTDGVTGAGMYPGEMSLYNTSAPNCTAAMPSYTNTLGPQERLSVSLNKPHYTFSPLQVPITREASPSQEVPDDRIPGGAWSPAFRRVPLFGADLTSDSDSPNLTRPPSPDAIQRRLPSSTAFRPAGLGLSHGGSHEARGPDEFMENNCGETNRFMNNHRHQGGESFLKRKQNFGNAHMDLHDTDIGNSQRVWSGEYIPEARTDQAGTHFDNTMHKTRHQMSFMDLYREVDESRDFRSTFEDPVAERSVMVDKVCSEQPGKRSLKNEPRNWNENPGVGNVCTDRSLASCARNAHTEVRPDRTCMSPRPHSVGGRHPLKSQPFCDPLIHTSYNSFIPLATSPSPFTIPAADPPAQSSAQLVPTPEPDDHESGPALRSPELSLGDFSLRSTPDWKPHAAPIAGRTAYSVFGSRTSSPGLVTRHPPSLVEGALLLNGTHRNAHQCQEELFPGHGSPPPPKGGGGDEWKSTASDDELLMLSQDAGSEGMVSWCPDGASKWDAFKEPDGGQDAMRHFHSRFSPQRTPPATTGTTPSIVESAVNYATVQIKDEWHEEFTVTAIEKEEKGGGSNLNRNPTSRDTPSLRCLESGDCSNYSPELFFQDPFPVTTQDSAPSILPQASRDQRPSPVPSSLTGGAMSGGGVVRSGSTRVRKAGFRAPRPAGCATERCTTGTWAPHADQGVFISPHISAPYDPPQAVCAGRGGELRFPGRDEVQSALTTPKREVVIPASFDTPQLYLQALSEAIREHVNLLLFDMSRRYHTAMMGADTSGYEPGGGPGESARVSGPPNPSCKHGAPSKMVRVKKAGPNQGRMFFACGSERSERCGFFKWAETGSSGGGGGVSGHGSTLNDGATITAHLRTRGVPFYCECQLIRKSPNKRPIPRWMRRKMGAEEDCAPKKLYLRLPRKEASSFYAKDDLWVVSLGLDFATEDALLVRSMFYGPDQSLHLEIEPTGRYSPSNWASGVLCHAIHVGNVSSEFGCLTNIQEAVQPAALPILPHLTHRSPSNLCKDCQFRQVAQATFFLLYQLSYEGKFTSLEHGSSFNYTRDDLVEEMVLKYELNDDQAAALRKIAATFASERMAPQPPVTLIHGVFGAGKSRLLAIVVVFLVRLFAENDVYTPDVPDPLKILVSSITNVAVDRILLGLLSLGHDDFVRVGSVKKIAKAVLPFSVHATGSDNKELKDLQDMLKSQDLTQTEKSHVRRSIDQYRKGANKRRLKKVRIVGVTCAACAFQCLQGFKFPVVLLDECSQMTEPMSLLPIAKFGCQNLVLVGDPQQLDPTIQGSEASHARGLEQTLFDRLVRLGHEAVMLRTQYRCHPLISAIPNALFYGHQLKDAITPADRPPLLTGWPSLCFLDVPDGCERSVAGGSFYNEQEARLVIRLIDRLTSQGVDPANMGVITLYRGQQAHIVQLLHDESGLTGVQVSTVDAFQGGERDIIFLSCVRTHSVGFIDSDKRTNVALTRAKHHLLIVGHKNNLNNNKTWRNVIKHCTQSPNGMQNGAEFVKCVEDIPDSVVTGLPTSSTGHPSPDPHPDPKHLTTHHLALPSVPSTGDLSPPMDLSDDVADDVSDDVTNDVTTACRRKRPRLVDPSAFDDLDDFEDAPPAQRALSDSDEDLPAFL